MKHFVALFFCLMTCSLASAAVSLHIEADSVSPGSKSGEVYGGWGEKLPEFPGGQDALMQYLKENVKYPKECQKDSVQGRVYVSFVVDTLGNIVDPEVIRSLHPLLDAEALRVVKTFPRWKPGSIAGNPRRVKMTIPLFFKLPPITAPAPRDHQPQKDLREEPMARFPGGMTGLMDYLRRNIKYPRACQEKNIEGRVIVSFILKGNGKASKFKVEKSVHPLLDAEALRVLRAMPRWKPLPDAEKTEMKMSIPVLFRLNSKKKP